MVFKIGFDHSIIYVVRYNSEFFYVKILQNDAVVLFFLNSSANSKISAKVFIQERKKILYFQY